MKALDKLDLQILNLLQENAKLTNKEIAHHLGLTVTPVYERIKRLEREGYIKAYVAIIDKAKVGYPLTAFCDVSLKEHSNKYLAKFAEEIKALEEVQEIYHIAGMYDYLLKISVPDMQTYQEFVVNKLAAIDNIGNVQSSFVMKDMKHTHSLKLKTPGIR